MTDISQRLRERAKFAREEKTGTALGDALHFEEAADEIERLRAQCSAGIVDMSPTHFVNDILSACDASNWDADRNTGDYFRGLKEAYEHIMEIAGEYQTSMYGWTRRAEPQVPNHD